jgi:integrase
MTIAAMLEEWRTADTTTHGAGASTLKGNRWAANAIAEVAGHRDAVTLNSVGARSILIELSKDYRSTAKLRSVLGQALQYLVDTGRRPANPLAGAARVQSDADLANPTEWLTEAQAVETLAYFVANPTREHAALATSMLAGLRPGEACALSWDAVDFRRATIRVDFTVDRVTGAASSKLKTDHHGERHRRAAHRTVPMTPELAAILRAQRTIGGYVFAKGDGPLHPQDLFHASKAVSAELGHVSHITGEPCHVSPNGYRHTFASRLAARGFPAPQGAALMGHVDTTQWNKTYTHPTLRTDEINLAQWLAVTPVEAVA